MKRELIKRFLCGLLLAVFKYTVFAIIFGSFFIYQILVEKYGIFSGRGLISLPLVIPLFLVVIDWIDNKIK